MSNHCDFGVANCPAEMCVYCEKNALRAEVERLTREEGEIVAAMSFAKSNKTGESVAQVIRRLYAHVSDYESVFRRADKAERERDKEKAHAVALEAALRPFADACRVGGFGGAVSMEDWQRARSLFPPAKPDGPVEALAAFASLPKCGSCGCVMFSEGCTPEKCLHPVAKPAESCASCGGRREVSDIADGDGESVRIDIPCPECSGKKP